MIRCPCCDLLPNLRIEMENLGWNVAAWEGKTFFFSKDQKPGEKLLLMPKIRLDIRAFTVLENGCDTAVNLPPVQTYCNLNLRLLTTMWKLGFTKGRSNASKRQFLWVRVVLYCIFSLWALMNEGLKSSIYVREWIDLNLKSSLNFKYLFVYLLISKSID